MPIVSDACTRNIPVILLHCSNHDLVNDISSFLPSSRLLSFSSKAISYNPFRGLSLNEACQLLYSSIPQSYGVKSIGRDFIRVMMNILLKQGLEVDFQRLITCPHNDLLPVIDRKANGNFIVKADAVNLKADLIASQSESRTISHYLQDLGCQISHITNCSQRDALSSSITEGILKRQVVLINIGANTNNLLVDLLVNQLKSIFSNGGKFMIILDEIDLNLNKELLSITIHNSSCRFVLSYDDVYSALNSDEKSFTSTLGSVQKTVIHAHPSPMSCIQWSKYLGEYEKQEPEYSHNQTLQG